MFKIIAIATGVVFLLLVVFIIWRWTSVGRGMRQRDESLLSRLDPIGQKLESGETVSPEEIAKLASRPEIRFMLFAMLRHMEHPELIPSGHTSSVAQGESALAYWMMHPNELGDAPDKMELLETIRRSVGEGREVEFHVYRYKMAEGHWAAKEGWLLGLAGPMRNEAEPYTEMPGAFSRVGDVDGTIKPSELVEWYAGILQRKGISL